MSDTFTVDQRLAAELAIQRVVDAIDNAVDSKDWIACQEYFLDEIFVDFTSLAGDQPGLGPSNNLIDSWRTSLYADKKSHHMRSNHHITIDGDKAKVFSKGYALNILARGLGDGLWEVWGDYVHTLHNTPEGWKCSGMAFTVTYARGNESVRDCLPSDLG